MQYIYCNSVASMCVPTLCPAHCWSVTSHLTSEEHQASDSRFCLLLRFLLSNTWNFFHSRLYPQSHTPCQIPLSDYLYLCIFSLTSLFLNLQCLITYQITAEILHNMTSNLSPLSFPISHFPLNTLFMNGSYGFSIPCPGSSSSFHNVLPIFCLLKPFQSSSHVPHITLSS